MDIFLQPLIEKLMELWEKIVECMMYHKKMFQLHATLLQTISDLPRYVHLFGWSTKGYFTCPSYHKKTWFVHLKNYQKFSSMRDCHFLD